LFLDIKDLTVCYDTAVILNSVSIHVDLKEAVSLVGPNGAGKSTTLRAISGLIKWELDTLKGTKLGRITLQGSVKYDGQEITGLRADQIAKLGLILCPERGLPFREMTVRDNLKVGAYLYRDPRINNENLERVYTLFPILKNRSNQISGTLSGGERFMLAIGRSLMSQAKMLLVDEPSTGIAPKVKQDLFSRIKEIHELGVTLLVTEQDIGFAFDLANRNYVLSAGKIIAEGASAKLLEDEVIRKTYLGL
jgi:branched-chain amino acid transport system ATP-binding protein